MPGGSSRPRFISLAQYHAARVPNPKTVRLGDEIGEEERRRADCPRHGEAGILPGAFRNKGMC